MLKRLLFWGGGAFVLSSLILGGRNAASYVSTATGLITSSVKDSVPISFEIERARDMIRAMEPDIRKNMHIIAKEEVEVEKLEQQIAATEKRLGKDRSDLVRLKDDLASNKSTFKYAGRTYTEQQVRTDLTNRFTRFKTAEATLTSLNDIYDARLRSLEAARMKLEGMRVAQKQLEAEVENLEARLKAVEVAQTSSSFTFDDSQLARSKELVNDLRARLHVAEKLVSAEEYLPGEIKLDEKSAEELIDEVTNYLQPESAQLAAADQIKLDD